MTEHIVLTIVCAAGIGFMIYVFFSLQRAIRREQRDRLGARPRIHHQRSKTSIFTLMDGTARETNAFGEYKRLAIGSIQGEFASIRPALQPLRRNSSGCSR